VCGRPVGCKRFFEARWCAGSGASVCPAYLIRPFTWPLACMEIADRVHYAFARSRRLDVSLVFPTPSSDRCAIPLV
jgi:hypothetical protein